MRLPVRPAFIGAGAKGAMANAMVEQNGNAGDRHLVRLVLTVAVPLAIVVLAYALWRISDRLLYIGPLDRAAFGWAVVIPLWVIAPVAAGFCWRGLVRHERLLAAGAVAATIGAAASVLFWQALAYPSCEFGAIRAPGDWVLPSLNLGGVIGGGLAASGLLASRFAQEGHPWRAALLGATTEVIMVFAAILVASAMLIVPSCQRPPV